MNESVTLSKTLSVTLVLFLIMSVSGCASESFDNPSAFKIGLVDPTVSPRLTSNGTVFDAEIVIDWVRSDQPGIVWRWFSVSVDAQNGSVLVPPTAPSLDIGEYGDMVEVWYSETTGQRDLGEPGDAFVLTGMVEEMYSGALVKVLHNRDFMQSVRLPTDFP